MPIYQDFDNTQNPQKLDNMRFTPRNGDVVESRPSLLPPVDKDFSPRDDIWFEKKNIDTSVEINEFLNVGYRTMDRGLKNFFSGIPVPTKNGFRIMQVRISGGDKPYLCWAQDLKRGRIRLPVMAIKREGDEHDPTNFTPAFRPVSRRFANAERTHIIQTFRPVPSKIKYSCYIWAEHKRDLEYIHGQIRTRFNPVADFYVEDEHMRGNIFVTYDGMSTDIDEDVPTDQRGNKRYNYNFTMEGWLPLPELVTPTILGRNVVLKESVSKDILMTLVGRADSPHV